MAAVAVAIAYVVLLTGDLYLGGVPFKLVLVSAAIVMWWQAIGRSRRLADYRLGLPVLALAIAVPIAWTAVGGIRVLLDDTAGTHHMRDTLQHASRFGYLLLYFPLTDLARIRDGGSTGIWLYPVFALCAVTAGIYLIQQVTGRPTGTEAFGGVFKGVFEETPASAAGFRVFIGNQVLLIAACSLLLAELAARGWSKRTLGGMLLVVGAASLSQTRGIWLGLSVVCATTLLLLVVPEMERRRRRLVVGSAVAVTGLTGIAGILLLSGAVSTPAFLDDLSAASRVQQAPKLWSAFLEHPVLGDGLGAALPGYVQNRDSPWAYELTYLQILFQMGVVGLLAVMAVPLLGIWRAVLEMLGTRGLKPGPLAGASCLTGMLLASATNPYLLSSFGMLGIAIGLSLIDAPDNSRPVAGTETAFAAAGSGLRDERDRANPERP